VCAFRTRTAGEPLATSPASTASSVGARTSILRGFLSSRGRGSPRLASRVTSALKRGDLPAHWEAKARARHRLESEPSESRDSSGVGIQVLGLTAPGRCEMCRFVLVRAEPYKTGPRRIHGIFHQPSFAAGYTFTVCGTAVGSVACTMEQEGNICGAEVHSGYESIINDSSGCPRRIACTKEIPGELQSSKRKGGTLTK
jgi:hypothetical protein